MATFEEIKKANETIATMSIKGKEYAEVNQRIKAFRMVYPNGSIITDLITMQDGICTFKAIVKDGETILGTGYAQEKESSSYINKTSYIENCETSAVGRALGMCGFGIDTSICSAEELLNALNNQGKTPKKPEETTSVYATEEQARILNDFYKRAPKQYSMLLKERGVTSAIMLKKEDAEEWIEKLKKAKSEREAI